jgi:BirA family biotin operon repressor/biotin-[acetyl-CoA-carboxylase] ligase
VTPPVEHAGVALSVEAVAQQRAREGAAAGTAVVVDREIAGRVRGGVEWRPDHAAATAVISRPVTLDPSHVDAATLAASLAVRQALTDLDADAECTWPDTIVLAGADDVIIRAGAVTLLGPGRVETAIVVGRVGSSRALPWDRELLTGALVDRLREHATLLDRPDELRERYVEHCVTLGRRVRVGLLPHGALRGEASDVSADGCLVVTTAGGTREAIAMSSAATIDVIR